MEIVKAEDFGIEPKKANELTKGLESVKAERELLINEFKELSKLELIVENLPKFKELRLKIVKNRTQGINKWHKVNKEFFLTGGKFVDAIKRKEVQINEEMENKLMSAEKHFENLEKERIAKLQSKRVALLSEYVEDAELRTLSGMEEDVWESFLKTKKEEYEAKRNAEIKEEAERQAKIKAEKEEQERIRKENEKLKAEAKKREEAENARIAKEETERKKRKEKEAKERKEFELRLKKARDEKERIEKEAKDKEEKLKAELKAKEDQERKAKEDQEKRIESELKKGDEAKIKDLINDLNVLKSKYTFKAAKSKKMYKDVGLLIDKIIIHIK